MIWNTNTAVKTVSTEKIAPLIRSESAKITKQMTRKVSDGYISRADYGRCAMHMGGVLPWLISSENNKEGWYGIINSS